MSFENREYQNYILENTANIVKQDKSVILELDCGMGKRVLLYSIVSPDTILEQLDENDESMGKRVITYRLLTETFSDKKIIVFLQTHSSLQETAHYLEKEYGGVKGLAVIKPGSNSNYRKYIIENNRVVLSLPIVFLNTLKKYPELAHDIDVVIVNEVDQLIRRVSMRKVLCVPWNNLIPLLSNSQFIGMSGTLRDDHTILDESQLKLRKELDTLLEYIPRSELITIEDFIGTDLQEHIKDTEVYLYPVIDSETASLISFLTTEIKDIREQIIQEVSETNPKQLYDLKNNFYQQLPFVDVDDEYIQKLNRLLLLRKYVYSMPALTYRNHLYRYGFSKEDLPPLPTKSGKEVEVLQLVQNYHKSTVLCSFLSTVHTLAEQIRDKGIEVFIVEGKTRNKDEVISNYKTCSKRAVLIMSPVGERDIDIPQTELLIIFDLVNSPKTVYQKMKRSRGGKVVLLFYEDSSERNKVKRVISEIIIKYPWSTVLHGETPIKQ